MHLLWSVIIGFVIGLIARAIMPGRQPMGFIFTTIVGMIGALVASLLGQAMGLYAPGEPAGMIAAVIGAVIVLFVASRVYHPAT
jgi:uncharacterized membrane protein YeaQ/YmgE (transglycosylase-associated protein family)